MLMIAKSVLNSSLKLALAIALSFSLGTVSAYALELRPPSAPPAAPATTPTPTTAQQAPKIQTIPSITQPTAPPEIKPSPKDQGMLFAPPSIAVKQIEVKQNEFPPATNDQYKVGFECTLKVTPTQKDYSKYPRYTCFIDKPRTSTMNALEIVRVDSWPSADGITTKIVMIADKKSAKNPNPGRIRTAFQLMHEVSETNYKPVLKDFVYADGLLKK
jgi:hypothetical protein